MSFNEDDLDYEGYDFSVTGKLSEVRLVFLNRFIQEVSLAVFSTICHDEFQVSCSDEKYNLAGQQCYGFLSLRYEVHVHLL